MIFREMLDEGQQRLADAAIRSVNNPAHADQREAIIDRLHNNVIHFDLTEGHDSKAAAALRFALQEVSNG